MSASERTPTRDFIAMSLVGFVMTNVPIEGYARKNMVRWLVAGLLLTFASRLSAQELRVGVSTTRTWHRLVGTVVGPEIAWRLSLSNAVALEVAYSRLTSSAERTGYVCNFSPTPCPTEQVHDASTLSGATVQLPITATRHSALEVDVSPGIILGMISSRSRGLTTGLELGKTEPLGALQFGFEVRSAPVARRLAGYLTLAGGYAFPLVPIRATDSYEPFNDGFNYVNANIGISIRVGR